MKNQLQVKTDIVIFIIDAKYNDYFINLVIEKGCKFYLNDIVSKNEEDWLITGIGEKLIEALYD